MLTAKGIREVQFHKSMGGYKTAEVDDFLDRCAEAVEELTSQNEENKNKMQVLAETIVEYRNQEDSIRFALINAQRMAESVVKEANENAEKILADAKEQAQAIVSEAEEAASTAREQAIKDTAAEQAELALIRKEVADFKSKLLSTYREHLTLIGILDDGQPEEAEETASVESVEDVPAEADVSEAESVQTEVIVDSDDTPAEEASAYSGSIPDFSVFELKEDEE